jgi:PAS domain-containing protein
MVDTGVSPEREKDFLFNKEAVLLSWSRLYTYKGINIDTILDLNGKKIAGLKGSINIEGPDGLRDIISSFELDCEIVEMEDYNQVFEALQNREIFAAITNKDFGHLYESNFSIERAPIIFQPLRMQFALPKGSKLSAQLVERIDTHLLEIKSNNTSVYYKSMEKYLGGDKPMYFLPTWLIMALVIIFIIAIIFITLSRFLKFQVNQKTRLLEQDIVRRRMVEEDLFLSNTRYQTLFNNSPIALWEEDFSQLFSYLDELKGKGITDFKAYFEQNKEEHKSCTQKIKIIDVNLAALKLHQAKNKKDLIANLEATFTEKSFDIFKKELITLASGKLEFESESEVKTLKENIGLFI